MLSGAFVGGNVDGGINRETDDVIRSFTYTDGAGALPKGVLLTMARPSVYYDPAEFANIDEAVFSLMPDTSALATGRYDWKMTVTFSNGVNTVARLYRGTQDVVGRLDSEFGTDWSVPELDRLFISASGVNLVTGGNYSLYFANVGGTFQREPGDPNFSSLTANGDGSYTVTAADQSVRNFDANGLLVSRVDSNGNMRTYAYADEDGDSLADELVSITDEMGRTSTFAYTAGLVTLITDFTGATTTYAHDANGRITSITSPDPDGAGPQTSPVTSYAYNTDGRLSQVTDPLGNVSQVSYDFTGRVSSIEQACGGTTVLSSFYSQGVADLSTSGYDAAHPAPLLAAEDRIESSEDERGNLTRVVRDHYGNVVKQIDALGHVTSYTRDLNGLVTQMVEQDPDGGGPLGDLTTEYQYDSKGNLLRIEHADGSSESLTYDATFGRMTSHIDQLGRKTVYTIDPANGNLLSVTHIVGLDDTASSETDDVTTSYTYTDGTGLAPAGLVATETDPLGRVTRYTYNAHALVTSIVAAEGTTDETTTEFEYDGADNLTATIDPLGRRTEYAYDALDRMTQMTEPDPDGAGPLASPVWTYAYDARGNQRFVTDPLGNVTEYVYNERNWVEQQIEADPDGAGPLASPVTTFDYDCAGNLTSTTDPLGRTTTHSYDALNRLSTTTLPDPDGAGPLASPVTSQTYDALGNVLTSTDALGNVTSYRYDAMSRLVELTAPDPDGAGPLTAPVIQYVYDLAGQLISTTDPLGRVTSYEYDDLGRTTKVTLPDPDGAGSVLAPWTVYAYDKANNLLSETDRLGNATSYAYDALYRRTSETNANNETTSLTYDVVGNRLTLTDPESNTTTWAYDGLNRAIEETNELNATRYFSFDAIGNLIEKIDRNNRYTEYDYDALNRRIGERWLDPSDDTTVIHTLNWTYDAASQLTEAADAFADYDYSYDALGRATSIAATLAGLTPTVTLAQQFNANNRRTQLAATIGSTADFQNDYTFDNLNRMTRITQQDVTGGNSVADKRVDLGYNAAGQFDTISRYANLTGTQLVAASNYGYDGAGRLTGLTRSKGATTFAGYGWAYDAANRITAFTNSQYTAEDATYNYDAASQLTAADRSGTSSDESYTFDDNGNRITANGDSYTTGSNNRMTSDGTFNYMYDAEGNTLTKVRISSDPADDKTVEYTWDHRNRLTSVGIKNNAGTLTQKVLYTYDAFDRLIGREVDTDGDTDIDETQRLIYDGQHIALSVANNGTVQNRYLHGPLVDMVLADDQATGDILWTLADNQGTIRDLASYNAGTDTTTIENHRTFNAFGKITAETNAAVDELFAYTGRILDEVTGLQNHRARWYAPDTGKWLSEDPIKDGSNWYPYVGSSPTNFVDPSGLAIVIVPGKDEAGNPTQEVYDDEWFGDTYIGRLSPDGKSVTRNIAGKGGRTKSLKDVEEYSNRWAKLWDNFFVARKRRCTIAGGGAPPGGGGGTGAGDNRQNGNKLDAVQDARRQFDCNKDFRRWAHKQWKPKNIGDGNRDLTPNEILEALEEWIELGKPRIK